MMIKKTLLCLAGTSSFLYANPQGASICAGNASTNESGNVLEITVSDRTVIDWKSFSIQANETTRFVQPSIQSSVLNRVTGTEASQLMGLLQANGQVYLVNPHGVIVGKEGRIDTASFLATTLAISTEDFLQGGESWLSGESFGAVINLGTIQTRGGPVSLLAHKIENSGHIDAPESTVSLASGHEILLNVSNQNLIYIRPNLSSEGIDNEGTIRALEVKMEAVGATALAINLGGTVEAGQIVERGGRIFLCALGGDIVVSPSATLNAPGGKIDIQAAEGLSEVKGALLADGGEVHVLGKVVALADKGFIDVSSSQGDGGTVLLGGDYMGKNPDIANAEAVYIGQDARVAANAVVSGNGGKVIAWGDDSNVFLGHIDAKGGSESGDGGFVEISSKGGLVVNGLVSTLAPHGKVGTLLLDPTNVCITSNGGVDVNATYGGGAYTYSGNALTPCGFNGVVIDSGNLNTQLMGTTVTINTAAATDQGETGNIVLNGALTTGNTLTLIAAGDITVTASIDIDSTTFTAGGNINLTGVTVNSRSTFTSGNLFTSTGNLNITNSTISQRLPLSLAPGGLINLSGTTVFNIFMPPGSTIVSFDSTVGITATTTIDMQGAILAANTTFTSVGGAQSLTLTSSTSDGSVRVYVNIGTSGNPFGAITATLPTNSFTIGADGNNGTTIYSSSLTSTGTLGLAANGDVTTNPPGVNYFYITGPITLGGNVLALSGAGPGALTINTSPATTAPIDLTGILVGDSGSGQFVDLFINNTDTTTGTTLNGTTISAVRLSFTGTNPNTNSIVTLTGSASSINTVGADTIFFGGPVFAGTDFTISNSGLPISFAGPITVSAGITFTVDAPTTFSGALTSSGGAHTFTLSTPDTATFSSNIGTSGSPFGALNLTATINTFSSAVYSNTSLAVGPVVLAGPTTFNVTGPITLGGSITGGNSLGITTSSPLSLPTTIGTLGTPLGAFTVTNTNATGTSLNGGTIYAASVNFTSTNPTVGGNGAAILNGGPVTINTSGNVSFGGALSGGQNLTVSAGSGLVQFNGPVSGGSNFTVTGGNVGISQNFSAGSISFTPSNNITINSNATISASSVNFVAGSNISLGTNDIINSSGNIFFQGQNISATGAGTIQATGGASTLIMVVDAQNPSSIGDGAFSFPSGMTLCTSGCTGAGGSLLLYASHPTNGSIQNSFPSTINGASYSSGSFSTTVQSYAQGTNEFIGFYYPTIPPGYTTQAYAIMYKGIVYPPLVSNSQTLQTALIPPDPASTQIATQSLTATIQGVTAPNPKKACGVPSIAISPP